MDYAIAAILSITLSDGEIHPIAFYSQTLTTSELNYDTHNKELLAIYKSFWTWRHYLEGSATPIDVVINHKNLEYFSTTKILSRRQAWWSELLSQFNLVIHFCPGKLRVKPDALTRQWDIYLKGGDSNYATVNPHNFCPVFTQEQLALSLRATTFLSPVLHAMSLMDIEQLHSDICSALSLTPSHLFTSSPKNPTHNGPWTPMVFFEEIIICMYWTPMTSDFESSVTNMIIQLLDTSDKTKLST